MLEMFRFAQHDRIRKWRDKLTVRRDADNPVYVL